MQKTRASWSLFVTTVAEQMAQRVAIFIDSFSLFGCTLPEQKVTTIKT